MGRGVFAGGDIVTGAAIVIPAVSPGPAARPHRFTNTNDWPLVKKSVISIRMKFYVIERRAFSAVGKAFDAQFVAGAKHYAVNCPPG
jgi:hypothetical protein